MASLNFSIETINWFKSYLSDRQQRVEIDETRSNWEKVTLGVPQGSILGPILFLIYMNDIVNCDPDALFILFADDTTIVVHGSTEEEAAEKMNKTLSKVYSWFTKNKLHLNPSKTRYQIFNCETQVTDHLSINGVKIERVWNQGKEKTFKLVGLHIDEKLTWAGHITEVGKKINSSLYGLTRSGKFLTQANKKLLYSGLIHSHLTYGLPVWGHATKTRLYPLLVKQKKAIRKIMNLSNQEHTRPYFIKLNILQFPELIDHATLCYIQSGLSPLSPANVKALWKIRSQERTNLRDRGILLDMPVTSYGIVNHLPPVTHAKLWNNTTLSPSDKKLSTKAFKMHSKNEQILQYLDNLTPEEQEIILTLDMLALDEDIEGDHD